MMLPTFLDLFEDESKCEVKPQMIIKPTWFAEGTSCKDEASYPYYVDYMHSLYYRGYGQVRELYLEDAKMGEPSLVLQAPNLTISKVEIVKNLERTINLLPNQGIRKRYVVINFSHGSYVIGGYEYFPKQSRRQSPRNDYFYHRNSDQLLPIESLPDGRVSFAVCTDGRYVVCAGGHTYTNIALRSVYMFDTEKCQWRNLPDLPAPTSGAGIAFHNDTVHLLGGFDIILNRSIVHGEYVVLNLKKKNEDWIRRTDIAPGRARPLLLVVPDPIDPTETAIYSAGGYEIDAFHKPLAVARLERYNERFERWEFMDTIEGLQLEYGLSYTNNKLYLTANNSLLRQYDFRLRQWL